LAYDRCQIGIVTDSLPVPGLDEQLMTEPEHRFKIMRTQVDVVLPSGTAVLNAADATVLEMAELCDGEVLLYATDASHEALQKHREAGKRVLFVRDGTLVQADGSLSFDLVSLTELPVAVRDLPPDVLLAAIGAALSIGIDIETIITGLNTFETTGAERRVSA
jgi:cyanophycin synthetase